MESLPLKNRLSRPFKTRFWLEFLENSAHFPIANVLFEVLLEGKAYLHNPDVYFIFMGGFAQTYWLTRWQNMPKPRRFLGNLIGPTLYSGVDFLAGGTEFLSSFNHLAYWVFSILIGILQSLRVNSHNYVSDFIIVLENIFRSSILLTLYIFFEASTSPDQTISINSFFSDPSHRFITLSILFLGLIIGLANLTAERYLSLLQETSKQLFKYSE